MSVLGPPDVALAIVLKAWFETLKQDQNVWNSALAKFPGSLRNSAWTRFNDTYGQALVYEGYPLTTCKAPTIAVTLLAESPDQEFYGQAVGFDEATQKEIIGNVTSSTLGVMVIAENSLMGHIYSELIRVGCLIAEQAMLEAGFGNFKFETASDLAPWDVGLPQDYWVRQYNYSVLEQNDTSVELPDGKYVPAVVEVHIKRIIGIEPPLNDSGVVATTASVE